METATKPIPENILTRKDEITAGFLSILENHVQELLEGKAAKRMDAADFGQLLFIHPRHLTNTIKLTTGKSPCDFMEERLLLEAQKLLRETGMPIADIAQRFRYNDPTNFTKFFKGMCGMTPREYRNRER